MPDPHSPIPVSNWTTPVFQQNLRLLHSFDEALAHRLLQASSDEELFVVQQARFQTFCRDQSGTDWLVGGKEMPALLQRVAQRLGKIPASAEVVIMLGSECGYALHAYWQAFLQRPHQTLIVVESSAARLKALLGWVDIGGGMPTGRLHVFVEPQAPNALESICERYGCWSESLFLSSSHLWPGDVDASLMMKDYIGKYKENEARTARTMAQLKERNDSSSNEVKRVLLLDAWPNAPQTAHIHSVNEALSERHIETRIEPIQGFRFDFHRKEYRRQLQPRMRSLLTEFQPDVVLSYAYHAPDFVEQELYEVSGARWIQVISNILYRDSLYYPGEHIVLNERGMMSHHPEVARANVAWLPLVANQVAEAPVKTSGELPIVFVGNWMGYSSEQVNEFQQQFHGRENLFQYCEEALSVLGNPDSGVDLYSCFAEYQPPQINTAEESFVVFRYLLSQGTGRRRQAVLESIADQGLHVFGNWSMLEKDSLLQACLRGYLPMQQERDVFAKGSIFMNIHSIANVDTPNMRFFNTPGMGALQITNGGFQRFLNEDETLHYQTRNELIQRIEYARAHPQEMDAMRARGLARVRNEWTYHHWIEKLFDEFDLRFPNDGDDG